ncbi:hypothetical protein PQO03_00345 [Lentisphaera profundi]|uniref:Uncharacterized protein n=1 Tax=Lentisphaera profundi TaxID=1658616 RepID=A0ABY7VUB1_9BACT|nr:hypothetical protein [Lentisphaera profundi]WDE96416.1 hypothetical protein PQO03_00345 [Lentisphaera profundi]
MKLKYKFEFKFKSREIFRVLNKKVKEISREFSVFDGYNKFWFRQDDVDLLEFLELTALVEKYELQRSDRFFLCDNGYYSETKLEYEDADRFSAAYLSFYTKTEYDREKYYNEIIDNELIFEKKNSW